MSRPLLVAVMGPTATGKTDFAEALSDRLAAQLINADTFQSYRGMDIGTAKPLRKAEYRLIDIKDPDEELGVGEWTRLAHEQLQALWEQRRSAVVVGGSGLNLRALFEEYAEMAPAPDPELRDALNRKTLEELLEQLRSVDPTAYDRVDRQNPYRVRRALERALTPSEPIRFALPPFRKLKFGIDRDPDEVRERIALRVHEMMRAGWPDEVRALMAAGYRREDPGLKAHGYRHIWDVLEGKMEEAQAIELTIGEVRRYAKRQRTWLRKEPRLIRIASGDSLANALRHMDLFEE